MSPKSQIEAEIEAAAHKSEASHVPYNPNTVSEYNAYIRGAKEFYLHALRSEKVQAMRKLLAPFEPIKLDVKTITRPGLTFSESLAVEDALKAFDELVKELENEK